MVSALLSPPLLTILTPFDAVKAMSHNAGLLLASAFFATVLRFILVRLNRKLDRGEHVEGAIGVGQAVPGEAAEKGFRFLV